MAVRFPDNTWFRCDVIGIEQSQRNDMGNALGESFKVSLAAIQLRPITHLLHALLEDRRPSNPVAEAGMADLLANDDEIVKRGAARLPTVPAEDELLEVDVEVTTANAVIDTHHPALH